MDNLKQFIVDEYINKGRSRRELARELGITMYRLNCLLKEYAIHKRQAPIKELHDRKTLVKLFSRHSAREISVQLDTTEAAVEYWLGKHGIKQRFKYTVNEDKFDVTNPIFCYFAGLIATDGYLDKSMDRVSLCFSNQGVQLLHTLADYFEYTGNVKSYSRGRREIIISSSKLVNELAKMGIKKYSNKTFDVQFPSTFTNETCLRMYLRGVIEGDGNIRADKKICRLYCAADQFVTDMVATLNDHGVDCVKKYARNKYPGFSLRVAPTFKLLSWIYSDYEKFVLEEKFEKAKTILYGYEIVRHLQ